MSFEDNFHAAIIKYLASVEDIEATEINFVDQEWKRGGGSCETCSYTYEVIEIGYNTRHKRGKRYTFKGDMGQFMRSLT